MPRQARLDAPGVLQHVRVRGIERRPIFRDTADRDDFVRRLAALADASALTVDARPLLGNHAHLLVRTGSRPFFCAHCTTRSSFASSRRSLNLLTTSRTAMSPPGELDPGYRVN